MCFANGVSVVVGPPPDESVELNDEWSGFGLRVAFQHLPYFLQKGFDSAVCRSDEQFLAVLAQVLAQEVKTFVDGGDMRLGGRERHSPLGQIFLHDGLDLFPQQAFGVAGDDEVVRKANQVYLVLAAFSGRATEAPFQFPLQSVQRHIRQNG